MSDDRQTPNGPDLTAGTPATSLADGVPLPGHVQGEPVIVVRRGAELFAIGATCSHYGGSLADGLVVGNTVRCPWHHACFSLLTGEALCAPALNPVPTYDIVQRTDRVLVTGKRPKPDAVRRPARRGTPAPSSVAIVGAGAAGNSAAEELRRFGFEGSITLIDRDQQAPYDRPNLSKDYLAGTAPDKSLPLHPRSYYDERSVELALGRQITTLDPARERLTFDDGTTREFGAIILATGADPVRIEGGDRLDADFIVAGISVRPAIALGEQAGLRVEKGVVVDAYLETATKGIFAIGDVARWPHPLGGNLVRIEHWVVAQRQGQAVARTIVGERTPFTDVPFFWSQHYDIPINYVGHAERWEAIEIDGSLQRRDCTVRYRAGGRVLAVASIFRDRQSLEAELAMEQEVRP